ncbi:hypothetical protein Tcan_00604, partial [Toxocara canis]
MSFDGEAKLPLDVSQCKATAEGQTIMFPSWAESLTMNNATNVSMCAHLLPCVAKVGRRSIQQTLRNDSRSTCSTVSGRRSVYYFKTNPASPSFAPTYSIRSISILLMLR